MKDKLRALNIEDDDADRGLFRQLTAELAIPVDLYEAASFAEGKAMLQTAKFDCVFLNLRLDDAIGLELIPLIAQHRAEICPIIMISFDGTASLAAEAKRQEVYDYIAKSSLNAEQLERAIVGSLYWAERETELRRSRERLQHLSLYDALTELPNRTLLFDRLDQQIRVSERNGEAFLLMTLGVNYLKEVNDTMGHDAGDTVLRTIAQRLSSTVRTSDTVARLGGDEFACLFPVNDTIEIGARMAEKMIAAMRAPILIENQPVTVAISIGIAQYPLHGSDSRTLLRRADQAMYQAKQGSKGVQMYSPDFNFIESPSPLLANSLEHAVANGELRVHYQPQIQLGTGKIVGKEALARWQHPQHGLIMPDKFIRAAERSAVISALTFAVLKAALDEEQSWWAHGFCSPVSVNLSARLLDDESLPGRIMKMLSDRKLPPECLILELTETALFSAPAEGRKTLRTMSEAGLRISIDDFGAGYTSLKQLRELEIAEIKIDGLYVKNTLLMERDASIIRSIVELGHGFGIPVIAECIERKESWQLLQGLGCGFGQGYSIGRPMSRTDFDSWMDTWNLLNSSQFELGLGTQLANGVAHGQTIH